MNVAELGAHDIQNFGTYDALVSGARSWTNAALHEASQRLAAAWSALDVRPGDRIVLAVPSGRAAIVASTAAWRCGAIVVYASPGAPANELENIVAHCSPTVMVAAPHVLQHAFAVRIAHATKPGSPHVSIDELVAHHAPRTEVVTRAPEDPAQLVYTSGTTGGALKAAIYTHGGLVANLLARRNPDPGAPTIVSIVGLPPTSFAGHLLVGRWQARTKLVVLEEFDPEKFLAAILEHQVTRVSLVPSMGEALVTIGEPRCTSVKEIVLSGAHSAPTLVDRLERMFGVRPAITYGMTETGGAISWTTATARAGSVGQIVGGVEVQALDGAGRPCAPGAVGEVRVRSPWVASGYWQDPEASRSVFRAGWVHTGDLGRIDPDGELYLVGRSKDIIIQAGYNVVPREIADVIAAVHGVAVCEVVGVPHSVLGEEVVACVVRARDSRVSAQEILAHCRARLDPRKLPGRVLFRDELPLGDGGKVKTAALREWVTGQTIDASGTELVRHLRAAGGDARIALLRSEITRLAVDARDPDLADAMDPDASFADNGLVSMDNVHLAHELTGLLGTAVPVTHTYKFPSVVALAERLLRELGLAPASTLEPEVRAAPAVEQTRSGPEPIAIVGMACRLPGGADDPDQFWTLLCNGTDSVRDAPRERWWDIDEIYEPGPPRHGKTYVRHASYLDHADQFDAAFFNLVAEAKGIDPQHRVLLEVAWEAFEAAGYDPRAVPGRVGVMVGISGTTYPSGDTLGNSPSMVVGRLCHFLNLGGPALAIDTSCSSSLVALHEAVRTLRLEECDVAIVAGVSIMSTSDVMVHSSQLELLARDGRCKAFDASGDGLGSGEGCIAIVVKRLADAIAAGDRVHGVIRGSAVNHDGHSSSLTAPNPRAQADVIRRALANAQTAAEHVQYVEAHGTGTILGDPIEVEALTDVFRQRAASLAIGSVKSNIGHLIAAAGLAGVLKTVLALRHRQLPASLHVRALNPYVPWRDIPIRVQRELGPWPDPHAPLVAGVNSFGLSGTNAHVVLAEAPVVAPIAFEREEISRALPISARTPAALKDAARRFADMLDAPTGSFREIAYTASCRRAHLPHRIVALGASVEQWQRQLRAFLAEQPAPRVVTGHARTASRVVFVFPGQGSQWPGMGRELYARVPVFRAAIDRCAAAMQEHIEWSLVEQLHAGPEGSRFGEVAVVQPALFAMQFALATVMQEWGVHPSAVIGHSMGELAAACVSGALSLEAAAKVMCIRARLLSRVTGRGGMAVVDLDRKRVETEIAEYGGKVSIAAVNGPRSTVVSGDAAMVGELLARLAKRDVFARLVRVDFASHSNQVDELERDLIAQLGTIESGRGTIRFVSTTTLAEEPRLDARYWWANLRSPVMLLPRLEQLHAEADTVFVEISPHPILTGSIAETGRVVATLRRDEPERDALLDAIAAVHCAGYPVDWARHFGTRANVVSLPSYPWQHERYWVEPRNPARSSRLSSLVHRYLALAESPGTHVFATMLDRTDPELAYFAGRRVPAEVFLAMAWEAARHAYGARLTKLREVHLSRESVVLEESCEVQLVFRPEAAGARFQIFAASPGVSEPIVLGYGNIGFDDDRRGSSDLRTLRAACSTPLALRSAAQHVVSLWRGADEVLGELRAAHRRGSTPIELTVISAVLAIGEALFDDSGGPGVVTDVDELVAYAHADRVRWIHARINAAHHVDYLLFDDAGVLVAEIRSVRTTVRDHDVRADTGGLHMVKWREVSRGARAVARGSWLVFADRHGIGDELCRRLTESGHETLAVRAGNAYRSHASHVELVPDDPADYQRLYDERFAVGPPQRIVHLWSLDSAEAATLTDESLARAQRLGVASLLHVVHELVRREWEPRVFLVTRSAQAAGSDGSGIAQSPLWGFGAALARELPRFATTLVDLDAATGADLYDELVCADAEPRIALRGGRRLVPRLAPLVPQVRDVAIAANRTYLITGGLGGLGLVVAAWLVEAGARHLVLLGRSAPSHDARIQIARLEAAGASVTVTSADVADARAVETVLAEIAAHMPRLAGIVHAAGVFDAGIVANLDLARSERVMAPKVRGAWNLHRATTSLALDFFVMFSSIAGVCGLAGTAHYAAANVFLDALAHYRRSLGLAGQSIAWGAWSEAGLGTRPEARSKLAGLKGWVSNAEGAAIFGRLVTDQAPYAIVLRDWTSEEFEASSHPLFAELVSATASRSRPTRELSLIERLAAAGSERAKHEVLADYLRAEIGQQLGIPPEDLVLSTPLSLLGLDSLATQRLRNAVHSATRLSIALTDIVGATIGQLAARLGSMVARPTDALTAAPGRGNAHAGIELKRTGATVSRATLHQQLFWYVERDAADANPWIWTGWLFKGPLDRGAFDRSLAAFVRGHSIFRTAYREVNGTLELVVLSPEDAPTFELEYVDRAPVAESDQLAELRKAASEVAARGLDLTRGLVLRARLIRFSPERHALMMVVHHIATDGGALAAFLRRLLTLYAGECAGKPAHEDPTFQFVDYTEALVRWNETEPARAAATYWRAHLRGAIPVDVAGDLSRSAVDRHRDDSPYGITGSLMHAHEPAQLPTTVAEIARQTGATPPIVYLAALVWMLHRETGQTDICIEAVTSIRGTQSGLHGLQGMLSTWLVYRINTAGCTTFRDLVRRAKQVAAEAQEHPIIDDYYSFVPHTLRRVVFNYIPAQTVPLPRAGGLDVDVAFEVTEKMKRPWDLHVNVVDGSSSPRIMWSGSQDVFSRARLNALLQRYLEVLKTEA